MSIRKLCHHSGASEARPGRRYSGVVRERLRHDVMLRIATFGGVQPARWRS